jgi:hypothetical protein
LLLQEDRVPLTLQVVNVDVICSALPTQDRVEVTLFDGTHFTSMVVAQQLQSLGKELSVGEIVIVKNILLSM